MATSAFVLLAYNPFYLWDVGFQLSYAAVLSILLFQKPIYNSLAVENKMLDKAWQLNAVTLSAQILTLPLCIYHFHQVPNLFLVTNFIAVPLSSLILFGEIALLPLSYFSSAASVTGMLLTELLKWMNHFFIWVNHFRFAVTDGIQIGVGQAVLLYLAISCLSIWILHKKQRALITGLGFLFCFLAIRLQQHYKWNRQEKLIVYNISHNRAIEIIQGRRSVFISDSSLQENEFLQNFHLKPARIHLGIYPFNFQFPKHRSCFIVDQKKIILLDQNVKLYKFSKKVKADLIVLSGNPELEIQELLDLFDCPLLVFDGSTPYGKRSRWIGDCKRKGQRYFNTAEQGAFVMNL